MTNAKTLCLNMIVKNERSNLERCLGAIVDHIACWVIGDTGSSDGTQDYIHSYFASRNIPGELHSFPFHNFEQARNAALECAAASPLDYDYLLLTDADMELVVEDHDFRAKLSAPGYRVIQRTDSGLSYWNTRLVGRHTGARYHGVTHEYLDVPGGVTELERVWYLDHASGSNRVDKFERDIRLLSAALEKEPDNRRYWFYLAQSYRDAGRASEAAEAYAKRAEMGGWDEEAWYARLQQARCLRTLNDEAGFVRQALAAFNQRPQRAEPLYDLARYYREHSMNDTSVLFADAGLAMQRPKQDILFLEDSVYTWGLQEELSIAANYLRDPARKDRGRAACDWLALDRSVPQRSRDLARSNLEYYIENAAALMPSFTTQEIKFDPPPGYWLSNPSIAVRGQEILMLLRTVNYRLTEAHEYQTSDGSAVHTRNFLLGLDQKLQIQTATEILPPIDLPKPAFDLVLGFEDMRLFSWRGELWGIACVRELTSEGWCEQVLARIDQSVPGHFQLADWRVLSPDGLKLHEKNWMPRVEGDTLQFIYSCDPVRIVDSQGRTLEESEPPVAADQFRGGSQAIEFDGGWLTLIHEAREKNGRRRYAHRFVWFDKSNQLCGVSSQFQFNKKGIEFAAGLAWHPDQERLLISYGVDDHEAWIATVDAHDVRKNLQNAKRLPSGAPTSAEPVSKPVGVNCEERRSRSADQNSQLASPELPSSRIQNKAQVGGERQSGEELFFSLAPFLRAVDSPAERRVQSLTFDARMPKFLANDGTGLPQIHCFYEVLSDAAQHHSLIAATASMRNAGHLVRVWSYSPEKLDFLASRGVEIGRAEDVVPRGLFERVLAGAEIRYFSDIFRYALLYEHGGLWMDTDVVLLKPFPFHGDHFLNLQWRGSHKGHFICGNVMSAKRHSRHMRRLYEVSVDRFFSPGSKEFGDIGPKLLSDYVASESGSELKDWLFSPMFFNSIDWTEIDNFKKPLRALGDYLNDERVFGVHLWNARTNAHTRDGDESLLSVLSHPIESLPSLTSLADRFDTDKNRHTGNRHFYSRIYDQLLSNRRFAVRRLMEIGLCRGLAERNQTKTPSVEMWQSYFPFCHVLGVDLTDFSTHNNDRFTSFVCDQSKRDNLRAVAARIEPGSLDVIVDDGSHASFDQQLTLRELFPLLADGGWYFIEDLDWQPPGEDASQVALTKTLLAEIRDHGRAQSVDPLDVSALADNFAEVLFFDSHYELTRARLLGGLVAIRKSPRACPPLPGPSL